MEPPNKRTKWDHVLAKLPCKKLWAVLQKLENRNAEEQPSGAFKRKAKKVFQPADACFKRLHAEGISGSPVLFYAACIEPMLNYLCSWAPDLKQRLLHAGENSTLDILICADETTGGNVLATSSSKKQLLFYWSIQQLDELQRPNAWWPLACIPARDVKLMEAGWSGLCVAILRHLQSQRLEEGFLFFGQALRCKIKAYCGDYDSLRLIYSSKGAAARKPCLLCQNIVDRTCEAAAADDYFQDISCSNTEAFVRIQASELHSAYDELLVDTRDKSQAFKKDVEKKFGFILNAKSLLATPATRDLLTIQHVMLDSCHNFWAKGICSTELVSFQTALQKHCGLTLEMLQASIAEVEWHCADKNLQSPSSRRFLFHESLWKGDCYKGEASKTAALVPLMHYYGTKVANEKVASELNSFRALYRATLSVYDLKRGGRQFQTCDQMQKEHHEAFKLAYSADELRPKHHFRLHHAEQYKKFGYVDCFPCEAKHKLYKSNIADVVQGLWKEKNGEMSKGVLSRLLLQSAELLCQSPWTHRLLSPIYATEEVQQLTGLDNCRLSKGANIKSMDLKCGNVVFFSSVSGLSFAAQILLWAEYRHDLTLVFEPLQETPGSMQLERIFRCSQTRDSIKLSSIDMTTLRRPMWFSIQGQFIVCLPWKKLRWDFFSKT